jgi:long-chain acyl-CoA synthetase
MNSPWLAHYGSLGINIPEFEDRPFGSFIEEHARLQPDTVAMWYVAREISYSEYNKQANRFGYFTALSPTRSGISNSRRRH